MWEHTRDYPTAAQALAQKTAAAAGLRSGQRLLHVGNGCGDADRLWLETPGVSSIHGINPSAAQCAWQRDSLRDYIKAGRFTIMESRAQAGLAKLGGVNFDALIFIDCAYHFRTRQSFFHQAAQSLGPGGQLGGCDLVVTDKPGMIPRLLLTGIFRLGSVPRANLVSAETYRSHLSQAGFTNITIESIGRHVFPGFLSATRLYKRRYKNLVPAKLWRRYVWTGTIFYNLYKRGYIDYIVVSGVKAKASQ